MTNPNAGRNRKRGDRNEYKTRDRLVESGYHVTRAAGSLGPFDFIAFKVGSNMRLIQSKSFKPSLKVKKFYPLKKIIELVTQFQAPDYAKKEVWIWHYRRREPEIIEVP
jgi:Holliday junction resolvase